MGTANSKSENYHPIRILQIASGDLWAGAEAQLYFLAKALAAEESVYQHVILLNHGILEQRLIDADIPVTVLDEKKYSVFSLLLATYKTIKLVNAEIVHTHRRKENILGALSTLGIKKTISIRTVHGFPEHKPAGLQLKQRLVDFIDYLVAILFQKSVVAVSSELRDFLHRRYGSKVTFIPNGIEEIKLPRFADTHSDDQSDQSRIVVAFAGRLVPVKRVDLFIEIARLAESLQPGQFEFHIFGDGPSRKLAEQMIDKYQLQKLVSIKGFVPNIHANLANTDLLVITSDHEGLPMILLEAISLGIPVIARAVGEIPTVLGDGSGGCLVKSDQPAEFAEHIERYRRDRQPFQKAAITARQNLISNYTSITCAERYRQLYESIHSPRHSDRSATPGSG